MINLEKEAYGQAFRFSRMSKEDYLKVVDAKAAEVTQKWAALKLREEKKTGLIGWFRLLFVGWTSVWAPFGLKCAVTSMSGFPLYEYKEMGGKVYYLRPERSPGFPGS